MHSDQSTASPPSPPSPPKPAQPILASHLLELEERQRRLFAGNGRAARLSTGSREVDEVLGGGVERGVVLGISASVEGREGRLVSLHLLASTLIPHLTSRSISNPDPPPPPKPKAIVIDSAGSFPLALLASVLKSRLLEAQSQSTQNATRTGNHAVQETGTKKMNLSEGNDEVDDQVQRCLEMVAISRVFDVEGLWEVIGEVDHDPVSLASVPVSPGHDAQEWNGHGDEDENENEKDAIIASDEADELKVVVEQDIRDDDELEILDSDEDLTSPVRPPQAGRKDREEDSATSEDDGTEIIVVDNVTHVINELFARKERSDAHTLLTLLSSTLHTLSKTRNILIILHNTTNPSTSPYPPFHLPQNPPPNPNRQTQNALHATTVRSIFASAATKPALGQIFAQFPDVHVFMHGLPRGRGDAEILYGGTEFSGDHVVRYVTVVEVLKDEAPILGSDAPVCEEKCSIGVKGAGKGDRWFAYREQKWTAVDVSPDGKKLVGAFAEIEGSRGLGLSREKGGGMEGGLTGWEYGYGLGTW